MDMAKHSPGKFCARLRVDSIAPNPAQPRAVFSESAIDSLADSIAQHGLISPVLVRLINAGQYELIAGERRLRAVKRLGYTHVDAIIIPAYDRESAEIALIENIQRENLTFFEEAEACRAILERYDMTQEALAATLGRSPSALANRLRLLKLPGDVRHAISESGLSERHARALLAVSNADIQLSLIKEAADKALTVRQFESRIANIAKSTAPRRVKAACRDMRLYVNAVMNCVKQLRQSGVSAATNIENTTEGVRITIDIQRPNRDK